MGGVGGWVGVGMGSVSVRQSAPPRSPGGYRVATDPSLCEFSCKKQILSSQEAKKFAGHWGGGGVVVVCVWGGGVRTLQCAQGGGEGEWNTTRVTLIICVGLIHIFLAYIPNLCKFSFSLSIFV